MIKQFKNAKKEHNFNKYFFSSGICLLHINLRYLILEYMSQILNWRLIDSNGSHFVDMQNNNTCIYGNQTA